MQRVDRQIERIPSENVQRMKASTAQVDLNILSAALYQQEYSYKHSRSAKTGTGDCLVLATIGESVVLGGAARF
jgi:hypothetical protein